LVFSVATPTGIMRDLGASVSWRGKDPDPDANWRGKHHEKVDSSSHLDPKGPKAYLTSALRNQFWMKTWNKGQYYIDAKLSLKAVPRFRASPVFESSSPNQSGEQFSSSRCLSKAMPSDLQQKILLAVDQLQAGWFSGSTRIGLDSSQY
jgi:hypothetical protein